MSDAIVKLLLEEHQPDLLDTIDRAAGARLGATDLRSLGSAVEAHLATALRRAYEMGYREALAARARAEAAKATVSVLAEEAVAFAPAPPAQAPGADEPRDESADKVIAEMRALVTRWGEEGSPSQPPKAQKADLSLFGEALPEETSDDDDGPASVDDDADEDDDEDEKEDAEGHADPPPTDASLEDEEDDADGDDEDDDASNAEERASKPRVRRTVAEIAAVTEQAFTYIKDHPGTKGRPARDALGLERTEWALATRRLVKARRIFHAGATKARIYFPIEQTKRGRPKKLTKSAFILALPSDMPASDVVAAGRRIGVELDDRSVYAARTNARRRAKHEAAEARAKAILSGVEAVGASPRDPDAYRDLRRAYTQARRTDGIFVACQALVTLGAAEDSEHGFYEARRSTSPAHAQAPLSPEVRRRHAIHPGADPRVTLVIDYLLPALLERYGRPTAAQGYTAAHRVDLSKHSLLSETLTFAARVLDLELPPVFLNTNAPVTIFSIHGDAPAIGLGAFATALIDARDAAFVAANHLSYLLPGHYARRLVPHEAELRRWIEAALDLSRGATRFERLSLLEQTMLQTQVDPDERTIIARETDGLDASAIDLAAWFKAVDVTADRLGLVLCHDLDRALGLLRGGEGTGDEATEARVEALRAWSVGEDYLAVRAALGIGVE
jgi:hypothetical protein